MTVDEIDLKDIVIIGGGTAGWLTALLCKAYQPNKDITLIESEEIGILGAGEGTVPHFLTILDQIKIPPNELLKNCKATIKNGIKFTNWNGEGEDEHYFHSFGSKTELNLDSLNYARTLAQNVYLMAKVKEDPTYEIDLAERISYLNKSPFSFTDTNKESVIANSSHALHFDARDLAEYFKQVALTRGIKRVEGKVKDFRLTQGKRSGISSIILENSEEVKCDFVFDCSGFNRLIVGKYFKKKWKSVKDILPCNSAIPFFIKNESKVIEPYTEAIALKNGWVWKIPVQGRYGCGYVYDSTTTTEEDAKQEVRDWFGHDVEFPTKFTFEPGYYEEFWVHNCVAVGLSSGFLEPLEATSIWITCHMVAYALESFENMERLDQYMIDDYNEKFRKRFDDTIDFLRLHYITKRNDSDFWKKCANIENSDQLNHILHLNGHRILHHDDFKDSHFNLFSWNSILNGNKLLNRDLFEDHVVCNHIYAIEDLYQKFKNRVMNTAQNCFDHYDFIEIITQTDSVA
jgi:tryptophan halogenase